MMMIGYHLTRLNYHKGVYMCKELSSHERHARQYTLILVDYLSMIDCTKFRVVFSLREDREKN